MNQTAFSPFNLPSIGEEETNEAIATLRSGWLTTGPRTDVHEGLRVLKVLQCCQEALGKAASTKTSEVHSQAPYFVHASTFIDDEVEIGEGTTIWHVSHVLKNSRIGKNCRIGQNVVIGPTVGIAKGG